MGDIFGSISPKLECALYANKVLDVIFENELIDSLFKFVVEFKMEIEGALSIISFFLSSDNLPNLETIFDLPATN